ncbi:MAG: cytochrome c biogenesis protein CcsA [Leptospiraceae bacterium]|nr:cytochrome c biogenesis protein CcsA [Leptospiraceae bacterium]
MNDLGALCIISSFAFLLYSTGCTLYGIIKNDEKYIERGRLFLISNFGIILLAFIILITQLSRMDLRNYYVVMHSSKHLSFFYRATSIWAGSSGSLLFWNLLLNFFIFVLLHQTKNMRNNRLPVMQLVLSTLSLFFVYLAVFYSDAQPFREFQPAAVVGRGLNPLLQHWAMILHPPILYVGYVSFSIPFAIGMSALITGNLSEDWLKLIRKWSIFSWFFLGVGILLGSKWAYEELGWGGYWAWDPVENASLMPWLLSSAFIHSIIIQEKRGMLKFWNMLLLILSFHFTLLGTWITRSGVLEGPHSFAKSTIGTPFIIFIIVSLIASVTFLLMRYAKLKSDRELEAITSKEGSFLLNNFLLVFATFAILLGVFSPLLYGKEFKSPWYNSWGVPAGILLLLLMGASPLLAWRKGADKIFFSTLLKPFIVGIFTSMIYAFTISSLFTKTEYSISDTLGELYSTLTIGLGFFTLTGIFQEFYRGVIARKETHQDKNYFHSIKNLLFRNKRRYGGYLVHFSIVLIFIGYAGNAFKQNTSISFFYDLSPFSGRDEIVYASQDKGVLGNYQIEASLLKIKPVINGEANSLPNIFNVIVSQEGTYKLYRHLTDSGSMITERRFYPQISHLTGNLETQIPTSEPDIKSYPKEDFYIQLGAVEDAIQNTENPDLPIMFLEYFFQSSSIKERELAYSKFPKKIIGHLEIWINPLVKFIWIGSLLYFLSGLFILLPIGEKKNVSI